MLHQRYSRTNLKEILLAHESYEPYPRAADRDAWSSVRSAYRDSVMADAETLLETELPVLRASAFLEYARVGNRLRYEQVLFHRRSALESLVLAECLEHSARFLDEITDLIWAICEETYWGVPAHIWPQKAGNTLPDPSEPTVDLFAAETGSLLSWTLYLLPEALHAVSPLLPRRITDEVQRRIVTPLLERSDYEWMGFYSTENQRRVNNWNPWIVSNYLGCALVVVTEPDARAEAVFRALQIVDNFIDTYPEDGGCDEGPGYWGHAGGSLFDVLDLLFHASDGTIDLFAEPLIREIGTYIARAHIADDYFLNFADAAAVVRPDATLVTEFGRRVGVPALAGFGEWLRERHGEYRRSGDGRKRKNTFNYVVRPLRTLFGSWSAEDATNAAAEGVSAPPLFRDVWLPQTEIFAARDSGGSTSGWFVGAKGGNNDESHNHNDIGSFVVYLDGEPLLVDAGVETYTAKTFSDLRYTIWTMRSSFHTLLPMIDGVEQAPGASYRATEVTYSATNESASLELELATAYPQEANIERFRRTITLVRGSHVEIHDDIRCSRRPKSVELSFLTPCRTDESRENSVGLAEAPLPDGRRAGRGNVRYDGSLFSPRVESISITDEKLPRDWGSSLTRVVLTATELNAEMSWSFRVERAGGT